MKNSPQLILIFLIMAGGLMAQNPITPDTLVKKNETLRPDTIAKTKATVPTQQAQPAKTKVRKDTRPLKDRINFDLNTSFWINSSQVFGEISLLVSYRFPKILSIGTGPVYTFNYQRGDKKNLNGWGGKVFARAQLLKFFFLWTEYQGIDNQYRSGYDANNHAIYSHAYVDSWFLGAGVNIRLGRRFGINMSVLYDVLYDKTYSAYYSPTVYRVGFSF